MGCFLELILYLLSAESDVALSLGFESGRESRNRNIPNIELCFCLCLCVFVWAMRVGVFVSLWGLCVGEWVCLCMLRACAIFRFGNF